MAAHTNEANAEDVSTTSDAHEEQPGEPTATSPAIPARDVKDSKFSETEFAELNDLYGPVYLDACADDKGANAQVKLYFWVEVVEAPPRMESLCASPLA